MVAVVGVLIVAAGAVFLWLLPHAEAGRCYFFPATRSKTLATADGRESSGE